MSKLICDFEEFNSKKNNITKLIESYNFLLNQIINESQNTILFWTSESQKVFYNKIIERKAELDKLSTDLEQVKSFLNEVVSTYQSIEGKYS